jgi:putative oxidoreductase
MNRASEITHALLRIVAGLLFLMHGGQKLLGWFGGIPGVTSLPPLLMTAGVLELVGGTLVLFGLLTRPVAFVLAGEMAYAYFTQHAPHGGLLLPIVNHGELAVLYCFVFLYFAGNGAGIWSLDSVRSHQGHGRPVMRVPA